LRLPAVHKFLCTHRKAGGVLVSHRRPGSEGNLASNPEDPRISNSPRGATEGTPTERPQEEMSGTVSKVGALKPRVMVWYSSFVSKIRVPLTEQTIQPLVEYGAADLQ